MPNNPSLSFTLPTCPLCPSRIDLPGCFSYTTGHLDHKKRWLKKRRRDSSRETRWNWERHRVERSIAPTPRYTPHHSNNWQNNPILPVISYCASSILMTVTNKYILSFPDYNLNFFLLAVQVCSAPSSTSTPADICLGHCLRSGYPILQERRYHHIPGFQS